MTLRESFAWLSRRRRHLFGMNRRNVELVYARNPREHYPLADDKLRAKEILADAGVAVPDTLCSVRGLFELDRALEILSGEEHFVIKPANGSRGMGIVVVGERTERECWRAGGDRAITLGELRDHIAGIVFGAFTSDLSDAALVERKVRPGDDFGPLAVAGVPDIRVIVTDGAPTIAMLRVPTLASGGRANLHQGAIGVALDLATGVTGRAMQAGRAIERHPDNDAEIAGHTVPRWQRAIEVARAAAAAVPLGYLGVDLLVDAERGPLVIEINARPGLEIQNVHARGLGEALAEIGV